MLILSKVNVCLSKCGSAWTPIYSCFFFFLNITGCNHFIFLDTEFNYPYIFSPQLFCFTLLQRTLSQVKKVPTSISKVGLVLWLLVLGLRSGSTDLRRISHVCLPPHMLRLPCSQCWLHVMQSLRLLWCGHLHQPWKVLTDHFMLWRLCKRFLT